VTSSSTVVAALEAARDSKRYGFPAGHLQNDKRPKNIALIHSIAQSSSRPARVAPPSSPVLYIRIQRRLQTCNNNYAGKGVSNDGQKASITGAVAFAHYVRSLAPAYGGLRPFEGIWLRQLIRDSPFRHPCDFAHWFDCPIPLSRKLSLTTANLRSLRQEAPAMARWHDGRR
jgi:hypothetical protein